MRKDKANTAASHLPDFQSREELAEFWDTHSFTEYLDDLEPAQASIASDVTAPLSEVTQVRFDKAADARLTAYARERGIRKSTLLRMIALDWLRLQERKGHAPTEA
ncbi:MAG TPA: CopG family antitoxin [Ktedonobacterales bacterium]|jgi:hypothetical protein